MLLQKLCIIKSPLFILTSLSVLFLADQTHGSAHQFTSAAKTPPQEIYDLSINPTPSNPEFKDIKNGFIRSNENPAPEQIPLSIISAKMADSLFEMFKQDKTLAHNYLKKGCQAKAHKMSLFAEEVYQIHFGKVYVEGFLQVKTQSPIEPLVIWGWHVAPVVFVRINGQDQLRVFDPALFEKPVSVEEWKQKMLYKESGYKNKVHIKDLYFGSRFQYFPRFWKKEIYKEKWDRSDFVDTRLERLMNAIDYKTSNIKRALQGTLD